VILVASAISFNFFHLGHIRHLEQANKLGDKLVVIVAPDDELKKQKGGHNYPLEDRLGIAEVIKWLNQNNEVIVSIDKDGTVAETLRKIHPQIFAKGGDRTPCRMPQKEIEVCNEIGCKIVYGVGGQLNRSSRLKQIILNEN
jgi:cytidyltransferase-like protein